MIDTSPAKAGEEKNATAPKHKQRRPFRASAASTVLNSLQFYASQSGKYHLRLASWLYSGFSMGAKPMTRLNAIAVLGAAFLLAACDAHMEQMEADKLESFELSDRERAVAEAMIEGYKKETGMTVLRSREIARAACYAKSVAMPSRQDAVHQAYLRDYSAIDKNFYPWFANQGLSQDDAWKISERIQKGYADCSMGALIKKRMAK
jgi:hypothetical protein